ncbi:MAG: acyl carrier protein [Oscillospiraceae bacterium]|nr:acyl carrier protein [Oscillospiraceae bacterium]MBP1569217.1 acyl carrier protein [Oscillospiraceae bacterium]MBP1574723.1 acyl carrier protein [Oscillospiraceae bacterium]MBQ5322234.1 acyl carrier protein [Oscillospiraceae bacterium]MBQ8595998.1 acyl carrier protein [Oscillospiraceae bacterium]
MVFEKVREILCEQLEIDPDEITLDTNIIDDLGADSLDLVDFVMSLESEFDKEIPDEDVENIKTIGDIVSYIENSL